MYSDLFMITVVLPLSALIVTISGCILINFVVSIIIFSVSFLCFLLYMECKMFVSWPLTMSISCSGKRFVLVSNSVIILCTAFVFFFYEYKDSKTLVLRTEII